MTRQVIFKQFSSLFRRKNMLPWSGYCCVLGLRTVLAFTFSMKFACIRWTKRKKKQQQPTSLLSEDLNSAIWIKLIFKFCWTIKGKFFATFKQKCYQIIFLTSQKKTCSLHNKLKKIIKNIIGIWKMLLMNTWYI